MKHMIPALECDWGRTVSTVEDKERCARQAVQRMALHRPQGGIFCLKVCAFHQSRVEELTDPHDARPWTPLKENPT